MIEQKNKHERDNMQVMKINLAISENKTKSKKQSKLIKERHKTHFPQIREVEKSVVGLTPLAFFINEFTMIGILTLEK